MATKNMQVCVTIPAGADLTTKQFSFVSVDSTGAAVTTGAGEFGVGVLLNDPALGVAGEVAISGITRVTAGDTVAAGAEVASDADGLAVTAATGDIILGTAMGGGAAGEVISVLFNPRGAAA